MANASHRTFRASLEAVSGIRHYFPPIKPPCFDIALQEVDKSAGLSGSTGALVRVKHHPEFRSVGSSVEAQGAMVPTSSGLYQPPRNYPGNRPRADLSMRFGHSS